MKLINEYVLKARIPYVDEWVTIGRYPGIENARRAKDHASRRMQEEGAPLRLAIVKVTEEIIEEDEL